MWNGGMLVGVEPARSCGLSALACAAKAPMSWRRSISSPGHLVRVDLLGDRELAIESNGLRGAGDPLGSAHGDE